VAIDKILNFRIVEIGKGAVTVGNLMGIIVLFLLTMLLIRVITSFIKKRGGKSSGTDGRLLSIIQLAKYGIWTLALVVGLQTLGVDITIIVASSAAILVGLGFGLQNVFQDFVSGIILLIEGSIHVGDIVEVNGKVVQIREIALRTCSVSTREDNIVIIPNHMFIQDAVINWSHNLEPTRFSLEVGVSYSSDIKLVSQVLIQCAESSDEIIKSDNYMPFVRFTDFGESALVFELIFWSNNLFRIENTKSNLRFRIMEAFNNQGIVIPFRQVVIHRAEL